LQPVADDLRGPRFRDVLRQVFAGLGLEQLNADDRHYVLDHVEHVPHDVVLGAWGLLLDSSPEELDALIESLLPTIDAPYLALHGSPAAGGYAEWLQRFLPQATVEVWDGVGHFISFVEPQRFADRVREFVGP